MTIDTKIQTLVEPPYSLSDPLPRQFSGFRDFHTGEAILVCGCGASLNDLRKPENFITIGVNDVGRLFDPTYLVVLNPRQQFKNDRFRFVETSRAKVLFTQLSLGIKHPNIVRFKLGKRGGTDCTDLTSLPFTRNSPYIALCLAIYMGAKRIGLIGVDFTEHHFFSRTGTHPLSRSLKNINEEYKTLCMAADKLGVEIVNLSEQSRISAFPKVSLTEFVQTDSSVAVSTVSKQKLKIVSYATTPVAGVPEILSRCINEKTPHQCRCVWASNDYGNGVKFQSDIEWKKKPNEAVRALEQADVVIVHNGKVDPRHRNILRDKSVITMAHNYLWNVDQDYVKHGFPGVVVGQYQATLPEFTGWSIVPNPIPLWEPEYQSGDKNGRITICYTPSGKHERYPKGHRLYWHAKGYMTTMKILDQLSKNYSLQLNVIRKKQVSHLESLAMKREAHIVIDECVTGSYHRNSLEGLAAGCVVINGVGILPGVQEAFCQCAGELNNIPFVQAQLEILEQTLISLIESGIESLALRGENNRKWMQQHWDFAYQWDTFWQPVIQRAQDVRQSKLTKSRQIGFSRTSDKDTHALISPKSAQVNSGVSVIIPHGGKGRIPHLNVTLANLRNCQGIDEIIVVEMGTQPTAVNLSKKFADNYLFIWNDSVFERARTLNAGVSLAKYDLLLWLDNDLLVPSKFISHAMDELHSRRLDYLMPFTSVRYLSQVDSHLVMEGVRNPADCKVQKVFRSRKDVSGGAGLVRKQFVLDYGGMEEGFRGWGGEDNAWVHKVGILGAWGATARLDQHVYHLYHPQSGGNGDGSSLRGNPYYEENLSLLRSMKRIKNRKLFLRKYPLPKHQTCPWEQTKQIVLVADQDDSVLYAIANSLAGVLWDIYQISSEICDKTLALQRMKQDVYPDAIILFGTDVVLTLLSNFDVQSNFAKALVVIDTSSELNDKQKCLIQQAAMVVTLNESEYHDPKVSGRNCWNISDNENSLGLALLQPLSLVIGAGSYLVENKLEESSLSLEPEESKMLPVWLYWEGDYPDWIRKCHRTIFTHYSDVRLLNPQSFDSLWDRDRDIDIGKLCVAHRADFIRAFLLARYGGLWIDSDCLVMHSLEPISKLIEQTEFLAHRERSGDVSNGFIGARPGSSLATIFYQRICQVLKSHKPLGWTSLGSKPLTEILDSDASSWHELDCECIQPVCWRKSETFLIKGTHKEHEQRFDRDSVCYMLSNTEIKKYLKSNPGRKLLEEGTFFTYLLACALEPDKYRRPEIHTREWSRISFSIETLIDINPKSVLEVDPGFGRWGIFLREFCEEKADEPVSSWRMQLEGVVSSTTDKTEHLLALYDRIHSGDIVETFLSIKGRWSLVILGSVMTKLTKDHHLQVLQKAMEVADYVIVDHALAKNDELIASREYSFITPIRYTIDNQGTTRAKGVFVLSSNDPKKLRPALPYQKVFTTIFENNQQNGDESASGPGSSLAQTQEIRRSLPLIMANLGVHTLLDAPCGDFNWMKHVSLGIHRYIGADIVPELISRNREKYGQAGLEFTVANIASDPLPKADIIFCRDFLVHLPSQEVHRALQNFKRSGATYLLTTTFNGNRPHQDICLGEWQPINLCLPPYNFPGPLRLLNEKCTENGGIYSDKSLGLWRLIDINV